MKWFFLAFLAVPLVEIYFLIAIGGAIGAGWTIALVVLTAVVGAKLVSAQGIATLKRARVHLEAGRPPAMEMLEGLVLFFAGALLLTPGFFTDTVGFALLAPPLRRGLIKWVLSTAAYTKFSARAMGDGEFVGEFETRHEFHVGGKRGDGGADSDRPRRIIDADYEKID